MTIKVRPNHAALVSATQLVQSGCWAKLWPDAGEGWIGAFPFRRERSVGDVRRSSQERSGHEAARRARAGLRRFAKANSLTSFVTLTTPATRPMSPDDPRLDGFIRRLRRRGFANRPFPWVRVVEPHADGARHHAHLLVPPVTRFEIMQCWEAGAITDLRQLKTREEISRVASYVSKGFAQSVCAGRHRYERAQGFAPRVETASFAHHAEALAWLTTEMGCSPTVFLMPVDPGSGRPPSLVAQW